MLSAQDIRQDMAILKKIKLAASYVSNRTIGMTSSGIDFHGVQDNSDSFADRRSISHNHMVLLSASGVDSFKK